MPINSRVSFVASKPERKELRLRAAADGLALSEWIRAKLDMPPARPVGRQRSKADHPSTAAPLK